MRHIILLLLYCTGINCLASTPPSESWTFTFRFENDLFNSTDRLYTNGIQLNWISPELEWFEELEMVNKPGLPRTIINGLSSLLPFQNDPSRMRNISLSIGQLMFTPDDTVTSELIVDDRPYAGLLYGSIAFHSKNYRVLDTFELQAGFTGKWSLAQQAQNFVHSIRNIEKANGWGNQISTEPAASLIYERKYRVVPHFKFSRRWGADAILHAGGTAGTIHTYLNGGVEFRAGWNLPADFGNALIRPGGYTNAPVDSKDVRFQDKTNVYSAHIFIATSARFVLRDIFLDGNTFSDSHSIDKKPLVGDFIIGASIVYRKFKVSYAQVLRTPEFRGQRRGHDFGSISISYTY